MTTTNSSGSHLGARNGSAVPGTPGSGCAAGLGAFAAGCDCGPLRLRFFFLLTVGHAGAVPGKQQYN